MNIFLTIFLGSVYYLCLYENFPDRQAYIEYFDDVIKLENTKYNYIFNYIIIILYKNIVSNEIYIRLLLFYISCYTFIYSITSIIKKSNKKYYLLLYICILSIIFEYDMVRIRAGLLISVFFFALYLIEINIKSYKRLLIFYITIVIGLNIHLESTLFLAMWIFPIYFLDYNNFSRKYLGIIIGIIVFILVEINYLDRGIKLYSSYNLYRVLILIPISVYAMFIVTRDSLLNKLDLYIISIGMSYYLCLIFGSLLGIVVSSGEAHARVTSLLTVIYLFGLLKSSNKFSEHFYILNIIINLILFSRVFI